MGLRLSLEANFHSLGPDDFILQDDNTCHLQILRVERMEQPASSPDLTRAVRARVTNTITFSDLHQMLVEECDAIPRQAVTRLVISMRRRCHAVVIAYGSSTRYRGSCLLNE